MQNCIKYQSHKWKAILLVVFSKLSVIGLVSMHNVSLTKIGLFVKDKITITGADFDTDL